MSYCCIYLPKEDLSWAEGDQMMKGMKRSVNIENRHIFNMDEIMISAKKIHIALTNENKIPIHFTNFQMISTFLFIHHEAEEQK